jgi:molybdopterin-containing oxidoreductase family iron-sulfur binding subunit
MSPSKRYWRSLEELENTPAFQDALLKEFPEEVEPGTVDATTRRHFLGVMGASIAMTSLAGCVRRPVQKILPYTRAPEDLIPGIAQHYATATSINGRAIGLVVEAHEGRPTKIEGNPGVAGSVVRAGGTTALHQALVLDLYDPQRLRIPMNGAKTSTWEAADAALKAKFDALKAAGGAGLVILGESFPSPTLRKLRERFHADFPQARWFTYESLAEDNERVGLKAAWGEPVVPVFRLQNTRVVLSLDADFLGTEGDVVENSANWAKSRKVNGPNDKMSRLYAVEGHLSVTGSNADHRLRLKTSQVEAFAWALAAELIKDNKVVLPPDMAPHAKAAPGIDPKFVAAVAADLQGNRGGALIIAGRRQPASVHALVAALNTGLEAHGQTVYYFPDARRTAAENGDMANIKEVAALLNGGQVDTLVTLGGNPVYTAPADLAFAAAFAKAKTKISLCDFHDETSRLADWALPRAHFLEAWGDVVSTDGKVSIQQPIITPLWGGRSEIELLAAILGEVERDGYTLVRNYWKAKEGPVSFYKKWRRWLSDGFRPGDEFGVIPTFKQPTGLGGLTPTAPAAAAGLEVTFFDGFLHDGRFGNNAWLLETPEMASKVVWDNPALVNVKTAQELGVADEDRVTIELGGRKLETVICVVPGLADGNISLQLGFGRDFQSFLPYHDAGKVGFDVGVLRTADAHGFATGAKVSKSGGTYPLARTQAYAKQDPGFGYDARPMVREATLAEFQKNPKFAREGILEEGKPFPEAMVVHPPEVAIYKELEYQGEFQWGMAIDLGACTGCGACTVACVAENNISMVGKDQVRRGREMHWIRMDRYFVSEGDKSPDDVQVVHQPLGCHHCENAPCENVCPVQATSHSPEGLNDMAYNRCIGTRYCANNCPFKVRRFNFYHYSKDFPESVHMGRNPNVTVRFRGVIEKCTYCVQRINIGRQAAKAAETPQGKKAAIDAITPACAQACPTSAIVFGNIKDKDTAVSKAKAADRNYRLLSELNIKPRTSYLGKVRNPNPGLGA